MPEGSKKYITIDFTDMSGGVNSVEHPLRIGSNQVQPESEGFILKRSGIEKYPGVTGLTGETTFTTYLKMLSMYRDYNGTERLIALSGGTLYEVDYSGTGIGDITSKYSMSGSGEGWSCDSHGKHWICNGASVVKCEGDSTYRVGIVAPSGVTAAASAGVGLADGDYSIYASYGRRVSDVDKLYSQGQLVGTVTLGSGNNRITISNFLNSSDAQVGQKVIWIKGTTAGEAIHYFFYATNDNTTTTFVISSASAKNTSLVYEYDALDNGLPPNGEYIYSFSNRIWITKDNIIYYSDKVSNSEYNLEIFRAKNYVVTPYKLKGIFSVGLDLYINTESGILIIPSADPTAATYLIEPRWHFEYMRTVARWNNGVIGLTNDGVRIFVGGQFTNYDLSYPIKNKIDATFNADPNFQPCAYVYRRGLRNEYHLLYRDSTVSEVVNNKHAILNLDTMYYNSPEDNRLSWEFQPFSGNYCTVQTSNNTVFIGQSHLSKPIIYQESKITDQSINVYNCDGTFYDTLTSAVAMVRSKIELPSMLGVCWFKRVYALHQNLARFSIKLVVADRLQKDSGNIAFNSSNPSGGEIAVYDVSVYDASYYPIENAAVTKKKLKDGLNGRSCYVEIYQLDNDKDFKLMNLTIIAELETGNFL